MVNGIEDLVNWMDGLHDLLNLSNSIIPSITLCLIFFFPCRAKSKEKDTLEPIAEKKKIKEEKEDEKVEDVSWLICLFLLA